LIRKLQNKRPYRHTWGDNIKMDYEEMGYEDADYTELASDMIQ
jgi:hypothetical protein